MRPQAPHEHFFKGTNSLVKYDMEVNAYMEKRKMSGVRSKQFLEMAIEGVPLSAPEIYGDRVNHRRTVEAASCRRQVLDASGGFFSGGGVCQCSWWDF
ncbi:Protein of unknown function- DUF538 [Striga hermonthica]|uniref:Uncharacterized protein n=1 Tax=Striga hermonthica TaxID=68872 RepID=A0A9N7R7X0_STRHE|nr:Protein of unknown function- DUF538 [Striga hermonthica]